MERTLDMEWADMCGGGPQHSEHYQDTLVDEAKEIERKIVRRDVNMIVGGSIECANRLMLEMPEGPMSQQSVWVALIKAYRVGRESK